MCISLRRRACLLVNRDDHTFVEALAVAPDDQESDSHVSVVTKLVRAANKQQASRPGADPTSIMEMSKYHD